MPHSYIWHASFIYVTRLIHMWHASFIYVTWLIHICDMTHSYMWHASFIYVTCLIHMRHASFIYVTCLIHTCDTTHSYATCLIHICDMPHSYMWHAYWTYATKPVWKHLHGKHRTNMALFSFLQRHFRRADAAEVHVKLKRFSKVSSLLHLLCEITIELTFENSFLVHVAISFWSGLQCVSVCCSVLQCVAVCTLLFCAHLCLQHTATHRSTRYTLPFVCVVVCCSVLQCVPECCSMYLALLQPPLPATRISTWHTWPSVGCSLWQCIAVYCSVL